MAILIKPIVKLLRGPKLDEETVSEGKMGEEVDIIEETGDFFKVKTVWDDYIGYITRESVDITKPKWKPAPVLITASLSNIVYKENKIQSQFLNILPMNVRLMPLEQQETTSTKQNSNWIKVKLPSNEQGFIQRGDVVQPETFHFSSLSKLRSSLVIWARKFTNAVPYVWGGTSSFGVDCSGFVQLIYRMHNLPLERDASMQGLGKYLINIKREEVLPGDLLFFKNYDHVAMAISHFTFIHATTHSKPCVQTAEIDDPYWTERTIEYKRYRF